MERLIRLFAILGTASYLTGCTSLPTKIQDNVNYGDSKEQVIEALGKPQTFSGDIFTQKLTYIQRANTCRIELSMGKVQSISCEATQGYVNPAAALLSGMGGGLQQSNRSEPTTCMTSCGGYLCNTSCN